LAEYSAVNQVISTISEINEPEVLHYASWLTGQ